MIYLTLAELVYVAERATGGQVTIRDAGLLEAAAARPQATAFGADAYPEYGWSIRKFVKTARRYHTIQIQAAPHTITAADPLPGDLRQAIEAINHASRPAH